jgi:hypothetical protein
MKIKLSIFLSSLFQSEVKNHPQSHLDLLCRRKEREHRKFLKHQVSTFNCRVCVLGKAGWQKVSERNGETE